MIGGLSMNISIIGMPLFYGCDKPGVEQGPKILRENNVIESKYQVINSLKDIIDFKGLILQYYQNIHQFYHQQQYGFRRRSGCILFS